MYWILQKLPVLCVRTIILCVFMASKDLSETEVVECSETESDEECEETQQQINSVRLVPKKNTKSKVWKYFGFTPNEDGSGPSDSDSPKCKLCLKNVSA